jgi:xylulokinase
MKITSRTDVFLGVDIGTQGVKVVLISSSGDVLGQGQSSYSIKRSQEGFAEQDPEGDWWNGCKKSIAAALKISHVRPNQIAGMGLSSQTPNVVLVDRRGISTRPAIIWQDKRSSLIATQLEKKLSDAQIWSRQHFPLTAHSFLAPLIWLRENESANYQRAFLRLTTQGYFLNRLTGKFAVDPAVACGMLPLFSLKKNSWDPRVCDLFSIPIEDLPVIIPSHEVVGFLLPKAARDLGLNSGTPVVTGTGDTMADLLSAGVYLPGQSAFTYGTLFGIVRCISEPVQTAFCFPHAIENSYLLFSGVPLAGATLNWFRDNFAQYESEQAQRTGQNPYDLLSRLGEQVPAGCQGLLCIPFDEQYEKHQASTAGAAFVGLNLSHHRGHMYRALIEGIAYEARIQLERMNNLEIEEITAIGGGSKDTLWTQVISDVTGIRQRIPFFQYGAPLGDAFLAGWGCGCFSDIKQLGNWKKPPRIVTPNEDHQLIYKTTFQNYLQLKRKLDSKIIVT